MESWIKQDFWGAIVLSIDFSQSVDEKANVPYPTELASKGLDLVPSKDQLTKF